MDPNTSGQFPKMTPGQLGYPELTPAQLADPRTPVTVSGIRLELWQVGHIYGVSFDAPVDTGKWKEKAVRGHNRGSTFAHEDKSTGHQSSSGPKNSRGRQLSTTSSGTSGSFYARPARREGLIGPPTGEGPAPLPRIRSRSRERSEPVATTAIQPKYSLFPRVDPPRTTAAAPAYTATNSQLPKMSGSGAPESQPENKSVWERSPSPPCWKKTVKGAVSKGLRQVGSSLALRSKKSCPVFKDTPKTFEPEGGNSTPNIADKHVPPMPPISWNTTTTPGSSYSYTPSTGPAARTVTTGRDDETSSPSGGSMQSSRPSPTKEFTSRKTAATTGSLRSPPPEGRFRYQAERALAHGAAGIAARVQPFDPDEENNNNNNNYAAPPPPPIPPRSARRPAPPPPEEEAGPIFSSQHRPIQPLTSSNPSTSSPRGGPLAPTTAAATNTIPWPAPFTSPRPAPPPPPGRQMEGRQGRGRSRSITNLFRRANNRPGENNEASQNAK
ncbi:hypothetical protein QBC37DRAFT_368977 [Rhypophila decipiens]|uniref:Uncharacterized protein n=1 Tax=Rhypophila decipiens TaxID=261697 RepID=A0AAN7BC52_9PEZI|nr:hypothetical protein QBC37DRAFT_368977 [Rhypophila decipiens]